MEAWLDVDVHGEDYDEFAFLAGHAEWAGLHLERDPVVHRRHVRVGADQRVSALVWGDDEPEIVVVHGAGQNSHTWDTFAMAYDRPLVAVDLPGHGHSDWRDDRDYTPSANAEALAVVLDELAPRADLVVGMSLGGLSLLRLSALRHDLVAGLVLVDITPPVSRPDQADAADPNPMSLMRGPRTYASFQEMLDATAATMPHRSRASLIPGLRHNARPHDDGTWGWRYDTLFGPERPYPDTSPLWDDLGSLAAPTMLVRGGRSPIVVDEAVDRFRDHRPDARIEVVADAGHAVQNDRPLELARLVRHFLAGD